MRMLARLLLVAPSLATASPSPPPQASMQFAWPPSAAAAARHEPQKAQAFVEQLASAAGIELPAQLALAAQLVDRALALHPSQAGQAHDV